jgi:hypothetical protein
MTVSLLLRLVERALAAGRLTGEAVLVETGERAVVRDAQEIVEFVRGGSRSGSEAAIERREDSRWGLGRPAWALPGSDQRRRRHECLATTTRDGVTLAVRLAASGELKLAIAAPRGISVENPLAVAFAAGDVSRNAEIPFRVQGRIWTYEQR